jgi:hypothetical protein
MLRSLVRIVGVQDVPRKGNLPNRSQMRYNVILAA